MTGQVSPRKRLERARRVAMGVAIIQRPLRFIASRTNIQTKDENGAPTVIISPYYAQAEHAAKQGWGAVVNRIARGVL